MELGLSTAQVKQLQQIAFDELQTVAPVTASVKAYAERGSAPRCPAN
jgi:hypothetical protein